MSTDMPTTQIIEPLVLDFDGQESHVSILWIDSPEGADRAHRVVGLASRMSDRADSYIVVTRYTVDGLWRDATYEMTAKQMTTWTSYRRGEHSRPVCDYRLSEWLTAAVEGK